LIRHVSIAVCNYNRADLLVHCIESAMATASGEVNVCIVDNASTDGSPSIIPERFGNRVRLHVETVNGGSSGGFHRAVEMALEAGTKYILVLDSDCIIAPDAIPVLSGFLDENPDFSGIGPKLYWPWPERLVQELGGTIDWQNAECRGEYKRYDETCSPALIGWRETDYVAGCALMVRSDAIVKHGNIEPRYFLYFDDVEWQWRMRLGGARIAVTAETSAIHHCGASGKSSHIPTYYNWRNRVHFFGKYAPGQGNCRTAARIAGDAIRAVATCRALGLTNAANALMLGVTDGLNGLWGARDFFGLDLSLDREKTILPPAWEKMPIRRVVHVLECADETEKNNATLILEDPYGKRLTAAEAWRLSAKYRDELEKAREIINHALDVTTQPVN
jgi:GT2 family glycosyltransferase